MATSDNDTTVDGRHRRRQQNRDTVIDALIELFDAGVYQPSADEIATQAGVSPRSVFRYFDDLDDLSQAAIARLVDTARPFTDLPIDPSASLADRVDALVAMRVRLFEATASASRAARITAHRRPHVAKQLSESRDFLAKQVRTLFATELRRRAPLVPAVDALCSFETYDLMRTTHGLSRKRIEAAMREGLLALLRCEGGN